jgi:hypothetical protein
MRATIVKARDGYLDFAEDLDEILSRVMHVTETLWADGDESKALANATIYLEIVGHLVVAWMWLEQLLIVGDQEGNFYEGKKASAQYFFTYELPRVQSQLDYLESMNSLLLEMDDSWF